MTSSPLHSDWQQKLYAKPWLGLLFLVCAHIVSRVAISSGMKWDESEQILWAQSLALGYGPQPPLYTWMQWAICQVLGPSVLALAVLPALPDVWSQARKVMVAVPFQLVFGTKRT